MSSQARTVVINDTTLRDGEQSAGVAFTAEEKIHIAQQLSAIGVQELEIGIPAMGDQEREVMQAITQLNLDARTMAWCRLSDTDLQAVNGIFVDMVDLSVPVSDQQIKRKLNRDREWLLNEVGRLVPQAVAMGYQVCIGCEDASRADLDFIKQVADVATRHGASRLRFADTVGVMEPFSVFRKISELRASTDLELEMHAHDDYGLATANTVAAVVAGATHINTTVNGLGERAGNAPLEECVLALKHLYAIDSGIDSRGVPALSKLVEQASGRTVSWQKSIVGEGVFTHEAGIHVDGMLKDILNYQGLDPTELGKSHRFVLGKHSGTKIVREVYKELGVDIPEVLSYALLAQIRAQVTNTKRSPTKDELLQLLNAVTTGTHILPIQPGVTVCTEEPHLIH